jgi:hypothetical protein
MITLASSLQERAQRALCASPVYALRELRVEQVDQTLLISGQVNSFYHKQMAQEVVRAIVKKEQAPVEVANAVEVA